MNVEDYVKEALLSIIKGVRAAQSDEEVGGMIGRVAYGQNHSVSTDLSENAVTMVNFDLATTVENSDIKVYSADVSSEVSAKSSYVSRIVFTVPLGIPQPAAQRQENARRDAEHNAAFSRHDSSYYP